MLFDKYLKQIYCKEGTLCCKYPLEKRKIIKKTIGEIPHIIIGLVIIMILLLILYMILLIILNRDYQDITIEQFTQPNENRTIIRGWLLHRGLILASLVFTFLIVGMLVYQIFYFKFYFYDITNEEVVIKKGVISRKEIVIPFSKIQNVYVEQDFLDRIFGLYDVYLETAGAGSGLVAHIDGVNFENAEALKNLLLEKIKQAKTNINP